MTSSPTSEEVDSTSSSSSTTANDLDNFVVPGSGGSKIYPYLPPRIDEDKYQVNIPQLTTRKPDLELEEKLKNNYLVYSPSNWNSPEVKDFIKLVHLTVPHENYSLNPSLSFDSLTLEYLHKLENNFDTAWFNLAPVLAQGRDLPYLKYSMSYVDRTPTNSTFIDYREKTQRISINTTSRLGSYSTQANVKNLFASASEDYLNSLSESVFQVKEEESYSEEPTLEMDSSLNQTKTEGSEINIQSIDSLSRSSTRVQAQEKAEMRRKWQNLIHSASKLISGRTKGTLKEAQLLLSEALSMNVLFTTALTSAGSSAQASEDYAAIENARAVLGELVKKVYRSRTWIANLFDSMTRFTYNIIIQDPYKRNDIQRYLELEKLLNESTNLDLHPEGEEIVLRETLIKCKILAEVTKKLAKLSLEYSGGVSPLLLGSTNFPAITNSYLKYIYQSLQIWPHYRPPYSPSEIEKLLLQSMNLSTNFINQEADGISSTDSISSSPSIISRVILLPLDEFQNTNYDLLFSGPSTILKRDIAYSLRLNSYVSTSSSNTSTGSSSINEESLSKQINISAYSYESREDLKILVETSSLLTPSSNITSISSSPTNKSTIINIDLDSLIKFYSNFIGSCPIKINEAYYLQHLLIIGLLLEERIQHVLFVVENNKRSRVGSSQNKLSWIRVKELYEACLNYPLILPSFSKLDQYLLTILSWQQDVDNLFQEKDLEVSSKTKLKSGGGIQIKQVEILLNQGEKFPFILTSYLNKLKNEQDNAKLFLEKLKKSLAITSARAPTRRNQNETLDSNVEIERPSFSNIKQLVQEGSYLYTNSINSDGSIQFSKRNAPRELEKANSLVELAEEWIIRVKEVVTQALEEESSMINKFNKKLKKQLLHFNENKLEGEQNEGEVKEIITEILENLVEKIVGESNENIEEDEDKEEEEDEDIDLKITNHRKSLLKLLNNLVQEAENMPIVMEETDFLKDLLQLIEWSLKVRPYLPSLNLMEILKEKEIENEKYSLRTQLEMKNSRSNGIARPRLSEFLTLKQELLKIRTHSRQLLKQVGVSSSLSVTSSSSNPTHSESCAMIASITLPEEEILLNLVDKSEKFVQKLKKIIQNKEIKAGTTSKKVYELLKESLTLPVNFEYDLRPLKNSFFTLQQWLEKNKRELLQLNLLHDEIETEIDEEEIENVEKIEETKSSEDSEGEFIGMDVLTSLINSSSQLQLQCDTLIALRAHFNKAREWKDKINVIKIRCKLYLNETLQYNKESKKYENKNKKYLKNNEENLDETNKINDDNIEENFEILKNLIKNVSITNVNLENLLVIPSNFKEDYINEGKELKILDENDLKIIEIYQELRDKLVKQCHKFLNEKLYFFYSTLKNYLIDILVDYPSLFQWNFLFLESTSIENSLSAEDIEKKKNEILARFNEFDQIFFQLSFFKNQFELIGSSSTTESSEPSDTGISHLINGHYMILDHFNQSFYFLRSNIFNLPNTNDEEGFVNHFHSLILLISSLSSSFLANYDGFLNDGILPTLFVNPVSSSHTSIKHLINDIPCLKLCWDNSKFKLDKLIILIKEEDSKQEDEEIKSEEIEDNNEMDVEVKDEEKNEEDNNEMDVSPQVEEVSASTSRSRRATKKIDTVDEEIKRNPRGNNSKSDLKRRKTTSDISNTSGSSTIIATQSLSSKSKAEKSIDIPSHIISTTSVYLHNLKNNFEFFTEFRSLFINNISVDLLPLLEIFAQLLYTFYIRLDEFINFKYRFTMLINDIKNNSISFAKKISSNLINLIELGKQRKFEFKDIDQANQYIAKFKEYEERARKMLQFEVDSYLTINEMKEFIKQGESLQTIGSLNEILTKLRTELRKARVWKQRVDQILEAPIESGHKEDEENDLEMNLENENKEDIEASSSSSSDQSETQELLEEVKTICINLTEDVEALQQVNKMYCLCRQKYYGEMICCDTCEDWFHLPCIGMNATQAAKVDQYCCLRCSISSSINSCCKSAASLTNKWSNPVEHFKQKDSLLSKLQKRINKELSEFEAFKTTIPLNLLESNSEEQLNYQKQFDQFAVGLNRLTTELNSLEASIIAEKERVSYITNWFENMQQFFWLPSATSQSSDSEQFDLICLSAFPLTPQLSVRNHMLTMSNIINQHIQKIESSSSSAPQVPVIPNQAFAQALLQMNLSSQSNLQGNKSEDNLSNEANQIKYKFSFTFKFEETSTNYAESMRILSRNLDVLLPTSIQGMAMRAQLTGIHMIEDVAQLIDYFKWISWCHLALHLLRYPPPSVLLKKLVEVTKKFKVYDEKILKTISSLLTRVVSWKSKLRKSINKKIDEPKLKAIALEGTSLPCTSRIKAILKQGLDECNKVHPPLPTSPIPSTTSKKSSSSASAVSASTAAQEAYSTKTTQFISSFFQENELANSSDEEDEYNYLTQTELNKYSLDTTIKEVQINVPSTSALTYEWYRKFSYPNKLDLYDPPSLTWPPVLDIPKKVYIPSTITTPVPFIQPPPSIPHAP